MGDRPRIYVAIRPFLGSWRFSTSNLRFIFKAFDALGSMAPGLSLIIFGGQFQFSALKKLLPKILVCTFARLILAPVIGMTMCFFQALRHFLIFSIDFLFSV